MRKQGPTPVTVSPTFGVVRSERGLCPRHPSRGEVRKGGNAPLRVLFLGNHTVGVRALDAILERDEVVGVVAHPPDPEDGVRYLSVHDHARALGLPVIRMRGSDPALAELVRSARPDLLWITDYRYLVPAPVVAAAPLGGVNLHPSLLPRYRGRAPLNWAILCGERELGLTAHVVNEGIDSGEIIEQVVFEIAEDQDVGDAFAVLDPLYTEVTRRVLGYFRSGHVPRRPQDPSQATVFPRRRPADGLIAWEEPALRVRNLIRAVAHPYPGAFSHWGRLTIRIWKAVLEPHGGSAAPGQIMCAGPAGQFCVMCGDGVLRVLAFTTDGGGHAAAPRPGDVLTPAPEGSDAG